MKRFLAVICVLALCVVAFGFYRGWFLVSTQGQEDKSNLTITLDKEKIKADEEKAKQGLKDLSNKVKPKSDNDQSKD